MKEDLIKADLYLKMVEAVIAYTSLKGVTRQEKDPQLYTNAKNACKEYADHSGITYKKACDIAMEICR